LDSPPLGDVHHIETDDERHLQYAELKGKIKVAAQVGSVNDHHNDFGTFEEQKVPRHPLFLRVGGETIRTGQIDDFDPLFAFVVVS
jgi:hypothetical protein